MCLFRGCNEFLSLGDELETLKSVQQKEEKDSQLKTLGRDGHNCQLSRPPLSNGFFTAAHCVDGLHLPSSSKLTAAMAVILTWMTEAPEDKIIGQLPDCKWLFGYTNPFVTVFMQFITPAKVMGRMLEKIGIQFLYYFGSTSAHYKSMALEAWESDPTKKVLVGPLL